MESPPDLVTGAVFKTVVGAPHAPGRVRFPCGSAISPALLALLLGTLASRPAHGAAPMPLQDAVQNAAAQAAQAHCQGAPWDARTLRAFLRGVGVLDAQHMVTSVSGDAAALDRQVQPLRTALDPTHDATAAAGPCRASVLVRRLAQVTAPTTRAQPFEAVPVSVAGVPDGRATLLVMDPRGRVEEVPMRDGAAQVQLHGGAGRYVLQVMVDGPGGPEVAALWDTWAGQGPAGPEPLTLPQDDAAVSALLAGVRLFRAQQGLPTLLTLAPLTQAAEQRMATLSGDARLRHLDQGARGLPDAYRAQPGAPPVSRLAEVLAAGPTPGLAFQALLESPAHRRQLQDPAFTHVGLAARQHPATSEWLVTAGLARVVSDEPRDAATADILRVLNEDRRRVRSAPLQPHPGLAALAQAHAQRLASLGLLDEKSADGRPLADVALARGGVRRARAQLYRVTRAAEVRASAATRDAAYTHAAVGLMPGRGVDGLYVVVLLLTP